MLSVAPPLDLGGTATEVEAARRGIEDKLGGPRPRRGGAPNGRAQCLTVSIRLNPKLVARAKKEAKRRTHGRFGGGKRAHGHKVGRMLAAKPKVHSNLARCDPAFPTRGSRGR